VYRYAYVWEPEVLWEGVLAQVSWSWFLSICVHTRFTKYHVCILGNYRPSGKAYTRTGEHCRLCSSVHPHITIAYRYAWEPGMRTCRGGSIKVRFFLIIQCTKMHCSIPYLYIWDTSVLVVRPGLLWFKMRNEHYSLCVFGNQQWPCGMASSQRWPNLDFLALCQVHIMYCVYAPRTWGKVYLIRTNQLIALVGICVSQLHM
jgi:hypothetical protein